ncbi:MAG: Gfo/Idh/MocA family oxidoreductase [Armatimonadetes bacterium]|nr:Gfo/Idh/MocA family oxidoreductase [Armatimonadota bacterium]
MSEVRVGLQGCGGMGKGLVSQLVTLEGAKLVAGADVFEESRTKFAEEYSVPVYESLTDMLAGAELEAVIVATPNHFHCPNTVEVAAAGKHVFCEKPMALTLADCQAMIDACKQAGVKLQIGQVLRYLPDFAHAIDLVRGGDIGQPRHGLICRYSAPRPDWGHTWRDDPEKVGHYLFEVSVHEIDFMRCVFGKPVAVSGWDVSLHGDQQLWARATTGAIEFEGGAMCLIIEGMFNPIGRTEVEISGSEAAMRFNWGGQFKFKTVSGEGDWEKPSSELAAGREDGRRRELREWIEAIANDTPATIPGEEGKANIELALAILQASAEKRRIELPL